jgi:predicted  nucleic acid-binding Zn-ribbon protein
MDTVIDHTSPRKPGPWMRVLVKVTGVDAETLSECPPHDWDNVRAVGEIMVCTWVYQTGLFTLIGILLFRSPNPVRPDVITVAMFIATFILFIDSYMVMRSGWHLSGIQELKRGGLDISGGPIARLKAGFFLTIRIVLSIGLAQLTALFISLLIFHGDIDARIDDAYLKANAHLIGPAAAIIDGGIQRATEAVNVQTARVNALSSQVGTLQQNQIDPFAADPQIQEVQREIAGLVDQQSKAEAAVQAAETFAANEFGGIKGAPSNSGLPGYGLRYRAAQQQVTNAKARAQQIDKSVADARTRLDALRNQRSSSGDEIRQRTSDQLATFEDTLKAANTQLTALKSALATLTDGRERAIRNAVDSAPDHVNRETGFLAQIVVLEHLAQDDRKIAFVIILIDVVSFGFELAAVLAKITSYVPTTYAALLARNAYLTAVRIADEMMVALKASDTESGGGSPPLQPDMPIEAEQGSSSAPTTPPETIRAVAQPPKRGRGRPRKHPLPAPITGANGREDPGLPKSQPGQS